MSMRKIFGKALVLFAIAMSSSGNAISDQARSTASIEGPITGGIKGFPYSASIVDLKPYGYTEAEYFISGTAHTFKPAAGAALSADGRWHIVAADEMPYKTRILVRRPSPQKFNGTVIVEFMQEYFGSERDTNFRWNAEALLREGFGWVGVSLHHEGIDDPKPMQEMTYGTIKFTMGMTLARWDPQRYGTLSVPTSDLSYDILTQVASVVGPKRVSGTVDPLEGLKVRKIIAVGNTIAGHRLAIYANGVQPQTHAFDGFFMQDLTPNKLQLAQDVPTPTEQPLRTDVDVPVMVFNTTTAAVAGLQKEGTNIRFWEPAGSSHTTGPATVRIAAANKRDMGQEGGFCPPDYANTFPVHYISSAAIVALDHWLKSGKPAPNFPQLQVIGEGKDAVTPFDEYGNSVGGIRTPWVDVPVARYDWRGDCPGGAGRTYPLTPEQLSKLYKSPSDYLAKFRKATDEAVRRGVLLPEDAKVSIAEAEKVRW